MPRSRSNAPLLISLLAGFAPLLPLTAAADSTPRLVVEQAIETEAGAVEIMGGGAGSLSVRLCPTCPASAYKTDGNTEYYARSARISAPEWQSLGRTSAKTPVTVLLNARTRVVTRVLIDLPFDARRNP